MENNKKILWLLMLLPWLTVPFLGKNTMKRFSLTSLFMGGVVVLQSILSRQRGWWTVYSKLHPKVMGEIPFIVGPFFVGAVWILKFTYGKFLRYTFLNLVVDFFHIYIFEGWLKKMGIASLLRLKRYQALILYTFSAFMMYGFQFLIDKKVNPPRPKSFIKRIFS